MTLDMQQIEAQHEVGHGCSGASENANSSANENSQLFKEYISNLEQQQKSIGERESLRFFKDVKSTFKSFCESKLTGLLHSFMQSLLITYAITIALFA